MTPGLFEDQNYQDLLLGLVLKDRTFLRQHGHLLHAEDFKPPRGVKGGQERWIIATKALEHWHKYQEPVGKLLTGLLDEHSTLVRSSEERSGLLRDFGQRLLRVKVQNASAVTDRLLDYRKAIARTKALDELVEHNSAGTLTDDTFLEIVRKVVDLSHRPFEAIEYWEHLEERMERRTLDQAQRYPVLLIDPFDCQVRAISRGHLGVVIAPYKRGKSMFLIWITMAYALQALNVLYVTLEDPRRDVEDRFDSLVTKLPLKRLAEFPNRLRERYTYYRRLVRGRVRIVDGTEGGLSVSKIEQIYLRERDQGFVADAIVVDYDDEIVPEKSNKERRFEFAEIYRNLRRTAAKHQLLFWTAAQTIRKSGAIKALSGDDVAEDISKIRKASLVVSLGKGEWGPDSIYMYVAAHKNDKSEFGFNVYSNRAKMLIYDRTPTLKKMREMADVEEVED